MHAAWLEVMRAVSRHVSGHVWTCPDMHPDTRWTQVHCMRKYALETSPGADCENMCSAKIILSPYVAKTPNCQMVEKKHKFNKHAVGTKEFNTP